MTYHLQSSRKKIPRRLILVVLVFVFIFVGVFRSVAGTVFFYVFDPISKFFAVTEWSVPFVAFSKDHRQLARDYEELQGQYNALHGIKESYDTLLKTYTAESAIAELITDGVSALVLLRAPVASFDTFVIGAGKKQNVEVGMLAKTPTGLLLGEVREVNYLTSKIVMFSRSGETRQMEIKRDRVALQVEGLGGGSLISKAPKGTDVMTGDILIMPGIPHLPIAKIERIETSDADAYMSIYASILAPFSTLESVIMINAPKLE